MKGLLLKDFYNTRKTALILLCFPAVCAVVFFLSHQQDPSETSDFIMLGILMTIAISSIFSVMLLLNSLAFDEQSNYVLYALTTPVNRNTYLKSKYLYLALTDAFYSLISGIVLLILLSVTGMFQISMLAELLGMMLTFYLFAYLLGTCLIAVAIKHSAVKAGSVMSMCFVFMGISGAILPKLQITDSAKHFLLSGGLTGILAFIMLILLIVSVILFRKTSQWITRKEF